MANLKVKELTEEELYISRDELENNFERNYMMHSAIDLILKKGILKKAKLMVYQAVDPMYKSFMFASPMTSNVSIQSMSATWDPNQVDDDATGQLFSNIPNWNWNEQFLVFSSTWDMKKRFDKLFGKKCIIANTTSMMTYLPGHRGIRFSIGHEYIKIPSLVYLTMDTTKNYKVIKVEEDELPALKEELENDWRRTFLIYSAINLKLRKGELKKTKLRLFRAECSKYKSFTFMCPLFSEDHIQSITASWNPEEITDEVVGYLFSNVPAMNWNKPFVMIANSYAMRNRFNDLFNTKKIITNTIPMTECHPANHAYLMIAKAEDLKIQKLTPEYELMHLPSSAANLIHSLWDFNYVESEEGVRERLETYGGMAALNLPSKNVVSWIQIYMCGALGMTFTLEEHRRKGLASAVTSQLAKQLAKELGTVFLFVIIDNLDSIAFHKKIGFKTNGDVGFSLFIPSTALTPSDGLEIFLKGFLSCK